jgi:hypothetical protein
MEEVKWFISAMFGVLAANNLGFDLAVAGICQAFWPALVPGRHGMSKISHTEPSHHCKTTHWTHTGICQMFWPAAVPRRHGMSKISHTEPSQHSNITHWTHMEEMIWFRSAMLGVLALNNLGFALLCLESAKCFGQQQ